MHFTIELNAFTYNINNKFYIRTDVDGGPQIRKGEVQMEGFSCRMKNGKANSLSPNCIQLIKMNILIPIVQLWQWYRTTHLSKADNTIPFILHVISN